MRGGRGLRGAVPLLVLLLGAAGCLDFVAPEFPDAGQPASFGGSLRIVDGTELQVDGTLVPGREPTGFRRAVPQPALLVLDTALPPVDVGVRVLYYGGTLPVTPAEADGPIPFRAPVVEGVDELPGLVWYPYRPVGPDTFSIAAGGDLVLRVDPPAGVTTPAVTNVQWFVTIVGGAGSVRVSADGEPPHSIRIPASLLPVPQGGLYRVQLQVFGSVGLLSAPGDYRAQLLLETRYDWIVTRLEP